MRTFHIRLKSSRKLHRLHSEWNKSYRTDVQYRTSHDNFLSSVERTIILEEVVYAVYENFQRLLVYLHISRDCTVPEDNSKC